MTVMITVECERCGKPHGKPKGEHTRSVKIGRPFFCGRSCSAKASNASKRKPDVSKKCKHCRRGFVTSGRSCLEADFCGRSCASVGSMSDSRRESQRAGGHLTKGNLISPAEALKKREAWKYTLLEKRLAGTEHEFEFPLGGFVFDLAIYGLRTLVEFDGPYHRDSQQKKVDVVKDSCALDAGWSIRRVLTANDEVIPASALDGICG